jgi:NADPH-dependent ferric siderophore reductase
VQLSVTALSPVDHGETTPFVSAIETLDADFLKGPGLQCYVNAEFSIVNSAKALLNELGVDATAIATKPYWRRNLSNAPHGEPIKD